MQTVLQYSCAQCVTEHKQGGTPLRRALRSTDLPLVAAGRNRPLPKGKGWHYPFPLGEGVVEDDGRGPGCTQQI